MKPITLFIASALSISAAQNPTTDDLSRALASAESAWGVTTSDAVEFRLEPLNSCRLNGDDPIALTQPYSTTTTLVVTDEDGVEHRTENKQTTWIIRVNSACDWGRLSLVNTMIHEYGHVLIGNSYHSKNPKSVMFYVVKKNGQGILAEDRAALGEASKQ